MWLASWRTVIISKCFTFSARFNQNMSALLRPETHTVDCLTVFPYGQHVRYMLTFTMSSHQPQPRRNRNSEAMNPNDERKNNENSRSVSLTPEVSRCSALFSFSRHQLTLGPHAMSRRADSRAEVLRSISRQVG